VYNKASYLLDGFPVRENRRVLTHWTGSMYGFPGREKLQLSVKCKYRAKDGGGSERTSSVRRHFSADRYEYYIVHAIGGMANMKNVTGKKYRGSLGFGRAI
jgi:hypothetical protein